MKRSDYDKNNDTKVRRRAAGADSAVEILVELVGIEPTTSSLRTMMPATTM
jgi:hypothetical protein